MTAAWIESVPALSMQLLENGCIRLEDTSYSEGALVDVHPIHLRLMAEKLGLVREMSASEADALRMVDKLARRLKVLHERITQMDRWLWEHPDHENADISTEIWYSAATMELSTEFQAEIEESRAVVTPRPPSVPRDRNSPENGPLKYTQKRDALSTPAQKELLA